MSAIVWQADAEKALEHRLAELTAEEIDTCANLAPSHALQFAAERLTPARLDDCAARAPGAALKYAARHLTPERGVKCATITGLVRPGLPVDAAGQPISFPTGGFYSVAMGDRYWGSKREFVNYVHANGLVARVDLAKGRKNHDGFRNAPRRR